MAEEILQALELIMFGRLAEAQHILVDLLKADPHDVPAWLALVETMPDDTQRIAALEKCLNVNPDSLKARQELERLKLAPLPPVPAQLPEQAAPAAVPPAPATLGSQVTIPVGPPVLPVSSPDLLPAAPVAESKSPALKKNRSPVSSLEIALIVILVCMTLGTIVFLGWEIIQRWAAPLATPTLAATASTRSSMLLPSLTTIPTGIPSATPTPAGQTPSGPGLLYFTGENGCVIRWVSAQGGDSLAVGTLPADDCLTDANHWSVKRWSPDGSLFAMAMMDASQGSSPAAYTIQIMRFDGTPVYQLISGSGSIPTAGLAWSPDSKNLAYVVLNDTEGLTEMFGLRTVPVNGQPIGDGDFTALTDGSISLEDMTLPGQHFAWSPDGQALALSAVDITSKQDGLYLARSIEIAYSQFATGLPMNVNVSWSPDGNLVAFNNGLVWKVISQLGEEQTVVSGDSSRDLYCVAWTPDSTELICTVRVSGGVQQLMAFQVNGSGDGRMLLEAAPLFAIFDSNAQWSPGGTMLALRDIDNYSLYVFEEVTSTLVQLQASTQGDFVWATPGE